MVSNYIVAGFENLASIIDRFMRSDEFSNNFTREQVSSFFEKTCNKFLHSFGIGFHNNKDHKKFCDKKAKTLITCRNMNFFNGSDFYVDSGGYQISVGVLDKQESLDLKKVYYSFLESYSNVYEKAFILDISPGPLCKVFDNWGDVYRDNLESYKIASELPEHVKDKIIYIHHFRTPMLWKTFTKILDHKDMFTKFKYFATGGIVANQTSDSIIPCMIYLLPMVQLLKRCIRYNRKSLYFHILGGATFRDVFFYSLLKLHIKKIHDIDIHITFDSSVIFKGLMIGRLLHIPDGDGIKKISIKSDVLDLHMLDNKKTIDIVQENVSRMVQHANFKDIDLNGMYDPKTGTFYRDVSLYLMFYVLYSYYYFQNIFKKIAEDMYPYYDSNIEKFSKIISDQLVAINGSRFTRKTKAKAGSMAKSFDIIKNLDEKYCEYIVNKFLAKDEFMNLEANDYISI